MTTPADIIKRALQHIRVADAVESVSAEDSVLCLDALKTLLDAWQLDPRAVVGQQELTYTPSYGDQSFTIGPAGDVVGKQPAKIEPISYIRVNGVDTALGVGDMAEYNAAQDKASAGTVGMVAMNRGYDTATVYMLPAADGQTELHLWVQLDPLASFDALQIDTVLTLPAGMRSALEWCLAEEVVGDFDGIDAVTLQGIRSKAGAALRKFKRANTRIGRLQMPYGVAVGSSFDINAG